MSWAIDLTWKATAILCAAFALHYALRRASAAVRDLVWTLAFAGLLVLPVLSVATPDWQAPVAGTICRPCWMSRWR